MTGSEATIALAAFWMGKADEALESAELELAGGHLSFALNRTYYAAFYAVSAVLLVRGRKFGKHSAVRSAFHEHLVRPCHVPAEAGTHYDRLFDERHAADYGAFAVFQQAEVRSAIDRTVWLVRELAALAKPEPEKP